MIKVSPSILSADFANLIHDIKKVENADMLHIDVMDGHFVPNISIGVPVVQAIKKASHLFLDVHLMISDPLFYAEAFLNAGADLFCFHIESDSDAQKVIDVVKKHGKKVGIALKPKTSPSAIAHLINQIDMVLIMTVEPGFGGQAFMEDMLPKIQEVKCMAAEKGRSIDIQVDGGINETTGKLCVDAGSNILVAGSFVFQAKNPSEMVTKLQKL
ncbi:ribulose-phosphate 3-epimerase [Paludicola sp. MB14-C6]|uniref:ribulose-phosphate 3-epimerase n=1 Tax=Paludihabitans sp. MB14-C6 TaxID=3070656 RepID=UPI0027DD5307|nr:ribulose-phosphate 3-epimerase [Paludicola sp. MB14-C6]WMJ23806.1 ribulose-phosphate 3-epimerase [Paludicola sp. MB14-C6]